MFRDQALLFAAFSFAVPVLTRRPSDRHRLAIAYDRAAGVVRWLADGKEVYRVDTLGARIEEPAAFVTRLNDLLVTLTEQTDGAETGSPGEGTD